MTRAELPQGATRRPWKVSTSARTAMSPALIAVESRASKTLEVAEQDVLVNEVYGWLHRCVVSSVVQGDCSLVEEPAMRLVSPERWKRLRDVCVRAGLMTRSPDGKGYLVPLARTPVDLERWEQPPSARSDRPLSAVLVVARSESAAPAPRHP